MSKNAGHELVLVSSGAIGMGVGKLHLPGRPADMPTKQAAAAVGQCELMYRYDKLFSEYGHTVAQVLVTGEDARDEVRSANIEATLNRLLALGALPIVNENDTVSTAEIAVGDNDTLGAIVAVHLRADLLVLLTDIDGLYTADPHTDAAARRIERVEEVTDAVLALGGGAGSAQGTGGMATKAFCRAPGHAARRGNGDCKRQKSRSFCMIFWREARGHALFRPKGAAHDHTAAF